MSQSPTSAIPSLFIKLRPDNAMTKVAFVTQPIDGLFPPYQNSIGIVTYQLAHHLPQDSEILIFSRRVPIAAPTQEGHVRYRYIRLLPQRRLIEPLHRILTRIWGTKRPFFASPFYYLHYSLQVALRLRHEQADIIHIHNFSQFIPLIRFFNPDAKIVLHMHCEWLTQLHKTTIAKRLAQADLILSCSDYISNKTKQRFPQFAHKCQTLVNGIDPDKFTCPDKETAISADKPKQLLFVGRVSPEKGVHVLLAAFPQIAAQYPDVQLHIIGPLHVAPLEFFTALDNDATMASLNRFYAGSYHDYLRQQIPPMLTNQVTFYGPLSYEHVITQYCNADVFVFPSIWNEPFGMPIVEALASQVPVVVTDGGGIPEIVTDQQTGLIVPRDDTQALADAVLHLLNNPQQRQAIGKRGQQAMRDYFSWQAIATKLHSYYADMGMQTSQ